MRLKTFKFYIQQWMSPAEDRILEHKEIKASSKTEAEKKVWEYSCKNHPEFTSVQLLNR